jgi:hypothetical protein
MRHSPHPPFGLGPAIILHNQAVGLIPSFFITAVVLAMAEPTLSAPFAADTPLDLFNAVHRPSYLQASMVSILVELAWNWCHPAALPRTMCAACLSVSALLSIFEFARVLMGGLSGYASPLCAYTTVTSTAVQVAALVLAIPTRQLGALYTVHQGALCGHSQSRWRILGWITVVAAGLAALYAPRPALAAFPLLPALVAAVPSVLTAWMLLLHEDVQGAEGPEAASGGGGATTSPLLPTAAGSASIGLAAAFVFQACIVGTNGEAILDTYIGVQARQTVELATWNQSAVLLAMLLALFSEMGLMQGSTERRSLVHLASWGLSQFVRIAVLLLAAGTAGPCHVKDRLSGKVREVKG